MYWLYVHTSLTRVLAYLEGILLSPSCNSPLTCVSAARLEGFQLQVYNTSAVLVSWSPPQLPFGVQLKTYIVYYTQTTPEPGSPHSLGSSSGVGNTTMAENYGMVGGLYSNARYLFWVEAIVLELEGSIQTTSVVTARNATIFVPGEATIVHTTVQTINYWP